jgi:hypothetical protein
LDNTDNLWQVDIPIVLCNDTLEQTEIVDEKTEIDMNAKDNFE